MYLVQLKHHTGKSDSPSPFHCFFLFPFCKDCHRFYRKNTILNRDPSVGRTEKLKIIELIFLTGAREENLLVDNKDKILVTEIGKCSQINTPERKPGRNFLDKIASLSQHSGQNGILFLHSLYVFQL